MGWDEMGWNGNGNRIFDRDRDGDRDRIGRRE